MINEPYLFVEEHVGVRSHTSGILFFGDFKHDYQNRCYYLATEKGRLALDENDTIEFVNGKRV